MLGSKGRRGGIRGKIGRKVGVAKEPGAGRGKGARAGENYKERLTGLTKQNAREW